MMDIIYRKPPVYRGSCSTPQQGGTGMLSGFWCYLFGGRSAPDYRTTNGKNGSAAPTVARCWWQAFPSAPVYKTPPADVPDDDSGDPSQDGDPGSECGCPEGVVDEVYID